MLGYERSLWHLWERPSMIEARYPVSTTGPATAYGIPSVSRLVADELAGEEIAGRLCHLASTNDAGKVFTVSLSNNGSIGRLPR